MDGLGGMKWGKLSARIVAGHSCVRPFFVLDPMEIFQRSCPVWGKFGVECNSSILFPSTYKNFASG